MSLKLTTGQTGISAFFLNKFTVQLKNPANYFLRLMFEKDMRP